MSNKTDSKNVGTLTHPDSRAENVDRAFREGVATALQSHARKGNLVPVLRGNKVVLVSPKDIAEPPQKRVATLFHADLFGTMEEKTAKLAAQRLKDVPWSEVTPSSPFYLFVPQNQDVREEYEKGWSVTKIFGSGSDKDGGKRYGLGICTHNDLLHIGFTKAELTKRVGILADEKVSDSFVTDNLPVVESNYWNTGRERRIVQNSQWQENIIDVYYRPFDWRFIYYEPRLMEIGRGGASRHVMHNARRDNLSLMVCRGYEIDRFEHALVANCVAVHHAASRKEGNYLFPLYIYPEENLLGIEKHANLAPAFVKALTERIGTTATPEETFGYIYGVLHSPTYRERYADFLKRDFPKIPLPPTKAAFDDMAAMGNKLVTLHLLESPALSDPKIGFPHAGTNQVGKIRPAERFAAGRVRLNDAQSFTNVSPDVWEFRVGGYQPAAKWLDDRAGRTLSDADITHYRRMLAALRETLALLPAIDAAFARILTGPA